MLGQVETLCANSNSSPGELPTPSRRAYQWLKYLADGEVLETHIGTLRTVAEIARGNAAIQRLSADGRAFRFELNYGDHNWKAGVRGREFLFLASQGYCGAPRDVLEALLTAGTSRLEAPRTLARNYALGDDFGEIIMAIDLGTGQDESGAPGLHYDLDEIFARVNAGYFGGAMPRPKRLVWSRRRGTINIMGYFQKRSDTIMLSRTLDDPAVPVRVLDLVMYHELLHKQLGARFVNGRRQVHFPEFRQAERKFEAFAEADAELGAIARRARGA